MNELTSSRLLKLEKDNQTLQKTVDELRGAANQDAAARLSKASQENHRLNQRVKLGPHLKSLFIFLLRVVFATKDERVAPTLLCSMSHQHSVTARGGGGGNVWRGEDRRMKAKL